MEKIDMKGDKCPDPDILPNPERALISLVMIASGVFRYAQAQGSMYPTIFLLNC